RVLFRSLDFFALLVVAHGFFAGLVPGQVGQVDQAVDAALQADEDAEVGDRLDDALDLVALVVGRGEQLPRVGLALLHAERDAAALFVDVEDHHLDLVANLHHLGRVHVLVGPIHLGDVNQTLDALLDLDESAVVGDVGHAAHDPAAFRITGGDGLPRVLAQLLQAQRDAVALAV